MKTTIALGLAGLLLVTVTTLRRPETDLYRLPDSTHVCAGPEGVSTTAYVPRAAPDAPGAMRPTASTQTSLLAMIEGEEDPDRRSETIERLVESISGAHLRATLDSLAIEANPAADELRQALLRRWAENDAPAAAAWTSQLPEGCGFRAAIEEVATAWASIDLAGATKWVSALPASETKQAATILLAYEATRTEPTAALELASTLPPSRQRDDLLAHAVSQWTGTDVSAAAAWAMAVPDTNLRQRLLGAVAVASAKQNGVFAATLAATGLEAGEEQDRTLVSVVQRWAQGSPQAAASWVSKFPDVPSCLAAVENLVAIWTPADAEAAGRWLRELPTGPLRGAGIAAYYQALQDAGRTHAAPAPAPGM